MDRSIDELSLSKESIAKNMIGEIVLSENPENVIKKWRNIFKISQKALANELGITSSVVSDYESGRRKSPGIRVIKKYVIALIKIDSDNSGQVIKSFVKSDSASSLSSAILDIKEFSSGISMHDFCKKINAVPVTGSGNLGQEYTDHEIYGYTIVDSLKAITELSFTELIKLYGITTQRAMIFTKVSTGKTPMVAIKLTNLRPGLVVLHGLSVVDEIAKRIAKAEGIPLTVCRLSSVEDIMENLSGME